MSIDNEYATLPSFTNPKEAEYALQPMALTEIQQNATFHSPGAMIVPAQGANRSGTVDMASMIGNWSATTRGWVPCPPRVPKRGPYLISDIPLPHLSLSEQKASSSRELHEKSLLMTLEASTVLYSKLNRLILQRCKKGYLFDSKANRDILKDDQWLQDVWLWMEGM